MEGCHAFKQHLQNNLEMHYWKWCYNMLLGRPMGWGNPHNTIPKNCILCKVKLYLSSRNNTIHWPGQYFLPPPIIISNWLTWTVTDTHPKLLLWRRHWWSLSANLGSRVRLKKILQTYFWQLRVPSGLQIHLEVKMHSQSQVFCLVAICGQTEHKTYADKEAYLCS